MKVYVVFAGDYWGEHWIQNIFSNKDAATRFRSVLIKEDYPDDEDMVWIEEFTLRD